MTPLVEVKNLVKEFPARGTLFRKAPPVRAVDDVSFAIAPGETFGLVGESGCGKTTTGRCVLRLIEPTSGEIRFKELDVRKLSAGELRRARRHFQIVFQDPYSSLNPRMRVGTIVEEPLVIHKVGTREERRARVRQLFELVGLNPADANKYPHEFSGGQRQRIGIARALALEPSLVVADEPVSALDVSVQAQVVNLLLDLQQRLGLTYLFVAHDLRLVRQVCNRVAVMYRGRLVEVAPAARVFDAPVHPYTKALLSAIPRLAPGQKLERIPYDSSTFERLPLREVEPGHFAAIRSGGAALRSASGVPMRMIRLLGIALIALGMSPQAPAYDLVVRGGRVLDGSGNPWFYADVAVKDGRIAAIGRLGAVTATRTVDATGKIVTPGFIDLHSHSDGGIDTMELRSNHNMVAQGITLSVVNQDGRSPTPIRDQKALYEKQGVGTNVAMMVGHGTARQRAMAGRLQQRATDADIAAMQKFVEQEMNEGGFGLSSGLEYEPGRWSETREVVELTRVVRPFGGFYISHERSEGPDPMWHLPSDTTPYVSLLEAVNETITIGRETGVPVVASHLKAKGVTYWGSSYAATRMIRDARAQGIEVYADQYPYETSGTDGSTVLIPAWATRPLTSAPASAAGGRAASAGPGIKVIFKERLANAEDNAKIRRDIAHEIDRRGGPTRLIIGAFPDPKYVQKSLQFVADDLKLSAVDAAIWLQMNGTDQRGGARMRGFSLSEIDLDHIMQQEFTATCTDGDTPRFGQGTVHARFYGTMPRKIRHFVLDRNVISLPFAIRSMTSLGAQIMGLKDRGLVQKGYWADLVVIDLETIADKSTFVEPHQYPTGIPWVFVNGTAVVEDGKLTGATPGKVLTPKADSWRYAK